MQHSPDHYAALGISPEADQDVIAAAYRALLKKYHPDTGSLRGTASKEKLAQVLDAFEVLGDPETRAAYDAERATRLAPAAAGEALMALESGSSATWTPTFGPAGEPAATAPAKRRAAAWLWVLLPVLLAGSAAAWLMTGEDLEPPPAPPVAAAPAPQPTAPAAKAVAPQPAPAAEAALPPNPPPPPKKAPAPAAALPETKPPEPPPRPSAFILVIGEAGGGGAAQGNIIFNSRASCESFATRALERRRNAALNQAGAAPGVWHECRPVRR